MRIIGRFFPSRSEPASHFTPPHGHQLADTFYQLLDIRGTTCPRWLRAEEKILDTFMSWQFSPTVKGTKGSPPLVTLNSKLLETLMLRAEPGSD